MQAAFKIPSGARIALNQPRNSHHGPAGRDRNSSDWDRRFIEFGALCGKMGVSNSQPWCGRRGHSEKGQPASPRGVGLGSSRVRQMPRNRPSQGRRVLRAAFAAPSSREQACTPTHRDEGLGAAENDWREGCQGRGSRSRPLCCGDEATWGRQRGCLRGVPRKCAQRPTLGQDGGWEGCRPCRAKPAGIL